jgi:hydroxymethylbilane synthase
MNKNIENIIIGSRSSLLAKKHIEIFENNFKKVFGKSTEIKILKKYFKTSGDLFLNRKISEIGNKGLFTKEIDDALLNDKINVGIHSLKDLPTELPKGLEIGAVLRRENFREALVSNKNRNLENLKKNAVVGTSSIRREMQLKNKRPDLRIKEIRGNIDTRIRKLREREFDAIILAYAGLKRLGVSSCCHIINPRTIVPALGQGAIALVINKTHNDVKKIISRLNHNKTFIETECERIFLKALDGSCETPVGGYAILKNFGKQKRIYFNYIAFSKDGLKLIKEKVYLSIKNYKIESYELGAKVKKQINN